MLVVVFLGKTPTRPTKKYIGREEGGRKQKEILGLNLFLRFYLNYKLKIVRGYRIQNAGEQEARFWRTHIYSVDALKC